MQFHIKNVKHLIITKELARALFSQAMNPYDLNLLLGIKNMISCNLNTFHISVHEVVDDVIKLEKISFNDPIITGEQLLNKIQKHPAENYIVISQQTDGALEEINLNETVDVSKDVKSFFVFKTDRIHYFELDGRRNPWGSNILIKKALHIIGDLPENYDLWLEKRSQADVKIENQVSLDDAGLEKIYSKKPEWTLKVNGVKIVNDTPSILASDALTKAGFNVSDSWNLILRVKDQPKKVIAITEHIDLSQPGIEKLRVVQKCINNGEKKLPERAEFALLNKDEAYLDQLGITYETFFHSNKRWLVLLDYPLPEGYNHPKTNIAIDIPANYPTSMIDMFYCYPNLAMTNGTQIPATTVKIDIENKSFQRWSRHLGRGRPWNPISDSVMTHVSLIEESLLRETEK